MRSIVPALFWTAGPDTETGLTVADAHLRLEAFLASRLNVDLAVTEVAQLSGGGANECHSFTHIRDGGSRRLVLRIKSRGACCETDIEREFYMLGATSSVLPVPTPYWMTLDADDFGAPALIGSLADGVIAPTDAVPLATGLGTVYGPDCEERGNLLFNEESGQINAVIDWELSYLGERQVERELSWYRLSGSPTPRERSAIFSTLQTNSRTEQVIGYTTR
ncbi:aminoglycoside phosphotransferase (APT) family kinase protein [Rhodococcus sp. LBL1]|nr:aminoglycoside phosphotransferase (APT) family kinase protein [Rhodococcus sp. LBL1]MDH6685097.1 aminoglycoside phosphotransferase (APT) family kinase protein [Rhodococcus sp. LBL2]